MSKRSGCEPSHRTPRGVVLEKGVNWAPELVARGLDAIQNPIHTIWVGCKPLLGLGILGGCDLGVRSAASRLWFGSALSALP